MDKRYQVFISSTYTDLQKEREEVMLTLMKWNHIPAGMELFSAFDEEKFNFITKVIDDSDYYILIIGGMYGTMVEDGTSYTEKEYDYAVSKENLKILAFIHGEPDEIKSGKSEKESNLREKLNQFREKVKKNRGVQFWTDSKKLPELVAVSISNTIRDYPAEGWVRANTKTNQENLSDIDKLKELNNSLIKEIDSLSEKNLAGLDDEFRIHITYKIIEARLYNFQIPEISYIMKWKDIFNVISPQIIKGSSVRKIKEYFQNYLGKQLNIQEQVYIDNEDFETISIHFKALKLITFNYDKAINMWVLTNKGEDVMMKLRAVKK